MASWEHRVAALEQPDEGLAAELERLAAGEAAAGRLALAATRLRWASDISPARADRERRLLTAAMHLVLAEESRGLALRPAVEETAPSPLRSCVLGTMAFSAGRLAEAERLFSQALGEARNDERSQPLAALIASQLAGTYELLGDGEKAMAFGRWALGAGCLDAAAASQARTLVAIGAMQAAGPRAALAELAYLDADPARVGPADGDALTSRGVFRLLGGDLEGAIGDLSASVRLARRAAGVVTGLRAYVYLTLALYLAGKWDDALLTTGQGFSAAAIQARQHELPLVHLASGCVPASRGAVGEAERHAALAEQAAADRAAPFIARTEEELAACRLPACPAAKHSVLALTSRETEVAHLIGKGLSNQEIAAELFISRKAVEYHLGNIYAKLGLQGRQELRGFVGQKNNAAISKLLPFPQQIDETPAQPGGNEGAPRH